MDNMTKPTKEHIEYEKGLKNLHELSLKKALSEDGIDTSKVPKAKLDGIMRLLNKQQTVRQNYQGIIAKAQVDAQAIITKAQTDMADEIKSIQKEIEGIVGLIKKDQGIIPVMVNAEQPNEKMQEKPESGEPEEQAGDD